MVIFCFQGFAVNKYRFVIAQHREAVLPSIERFLGLASEDFVDQPSCYGSACTMREWVTASEAGVDFYDLEIAGSRGETLHIQRPVSARHAFNNAVRQFNHLPVLYGDSLGDFTASDFHSEVRNGAQAAALAIDENIDGMLGA